MTRRERVIAALNHKETDITPFQVDFTWQELEKMIAHTGNPDFNEQTGAHMRSFEYEGFCTEIPGRPEFFRDDFGVIWNRTGVDKDIGMLEGIVLPEATLEGYTFPTLDKERVRGEYRKLLAEGGDRFLFGGIGFTYFERAWTLRGIENILMDMLLEPEFVTELMDKIHEYNLQILDIVLDEFPQLDGFIIGDDWGQQQGLIMGPDNWRKFIKPYVQDVYAKVKAKGKYTILHSCGDIRTIMPELIEIGLDCYQTFQPEIYGMEEGKRDFGGHITFWGGVSTQTLLPYATPEEVAKTTEDLIRIVGKNGGLIAAPTHAVPCDVPAENIVAMLEVFHNQSVK